MKKIILSFICCYSTQLFAQSLTIIPTSVSNTEFLKIKKTGTGLDHRTTDGLVGVGTYVGGGTGYIQTHTNHPLAFATNNSVPQMLLKTNGYFGIGVSDPQYILDVKERSRIRAGSNTAGIWFSKSNNVANEGSFFGNMNDNQAGIYIGDTWFFNISSTGVANILNLAGTGTRNVGVDNTGNLVALTTSINTVAFAAGNTTLIPVNGETDPLFNIELYDIGSCWDANTSVFTAPSSGVYHFTVNITWGGNASGTRQIRLVNNNGTSIRLATFSPSDTNPFTQSYSCDIQLNQAQTIQLILYSDTPVSVYNIDGYYFSGFKVN